MLGTVVATTIMNSKLTELINLLGGKNFSGMRKRVLSWGQATMEGAPSEHYDDVNIS